MHKKIGTLCSGLGNKCWDTPRPLCIRKTLFKTTEDAHTPNHTFTHPHIQMQYFGYTF